MQLPSADQYSQLIEKKDPRNFTFLNDYTFLPAEGGPPHTWIHYRGNTVILFKATKGGRTYAVRCFLTGDRETFRRYEEKAGFLAPVDGSWKVPFEFFDNEIFFEGQQYPVVVMDWEEGVPFNEFLDTIAHDPGRLTRLQEKLLALSKDLEEKGIGHGDLNFNHVRVRSAGADFQLRLIDYDSLFIPPFRDLDSQDPGTPGFQHPRRLATDFSETIDRFSFWIFLTALEAVKQDPSLWKDSGFRSNRHFLFTLRDLVYPGQSKLLHRLRAYGAEPLNWYVEQLTAFCHSTDLNEIQAPQLFKKASVRGSGVPVSFQKNTGERKPESPSQQVVTGDASGEEAEILEFAADKYSIREGESITLQWSVKGPATISISNLGAISEPTGKRKLVLKNTTNYVLSAGSKTKSLTIRVSPLPVRPTHIKNENPAGSPILGNAREANRVMMWAGLAVVLAIGLFILYNSLSGSKDDEAPSQVLSANQDTTGDAKGPLFTKESVTTFLNGLYADYNMRSLPDIMENYAPSINEYYDSRSIGNDSLSRIIHNLFITPVYYQCRPDFTTLSIQPSDSTCLVTVTILETIQSTNGSRRENYTTKIQYVLDKDLKIVGEKTQAN